MTKGAGNYINSDRDRCKNKLGNIRLHKKMCSLILIRIINNNKYKKLDKKFLDDALMTSIAGISAAMKNTG